MVTGRTPPPLPPDPFAEIKAQFGPENLETVLGTYRKFADRVDYRALVSWTMKQPIEDLLQPLFLAALVVITRELDLGQIAQELAGAEVGDRPGWSWQWGVRTDGPARTRCGAMANEECARAYCEPPQEGDYTHTPVRRAIGPWTEVTK